MDGTLNMLGGGSSAGRKPLKSGMKELAVLREKVTEQHRQMGKGGKHHLSLEEPKKLRPPPARVSGGTGSDGGRESDGGRRLWKGSLTLGKDVTPCPTYSATNEQTNKKTNSVIDILDDLGATWHFCL